MRVSDYFDEIFGAFRKQRLRTALTAVGIAIGSFAITLMVGLGQGLQTYVEDQFLQFGDDRVLMVFPSAAKMGERVIERFLNFGKPAERITEEDEQEKEIRRGGLWISEEQVASLREVDGVGTVAPMTWLEIDGIRLLDPGTGKPGDYYQTDFATLANSPMLGQPVPGRKPGAAAEVCLSPQYALSFDLAPEELIGREAELRVPKLANIQRRFLFRDPTGFKAESQTFRVKIVGLSERSVVSRAVYTSQELGAAMAQYQSNNLTILTENKIGFQAHVRVAKEADLVRVKKDIEKLDLVARSIDDQLSDLKKIFLVVDAVLTSFGLLALLVATLGIANTLLMAITERTREIGVMMALGMTRSTVRRMFAVEAAAIGFFGGLAGTLAALVLGLGLSAVAGAYVPAAQELKGYSVFVFPWWLLLGTPIFSALIGGLAGILPANRAAQLDPIEALHHD